MKKVKIGVIGCGMISKIYLKNCTQTFNNILEVVAVADLVPELAAKRAEEFNIPTSCSVDELLANPEIEIVINLTAPAAHALVNEQVLRAGKHVYTEKPFALNHEDAERVLDLAEEKGLLVGGAPDTFLGASIQTCIKLIEDGEIGTPYAANASVILGHPADFDHPNVQNFLKLGGDPILDMGTYYLTALVAMLGPVKRVTGSAQKVLEEVTITNENSPQFGETLRVEAPTNVAATLDFHNGVVANLQAAKESFGYRPKMEIFGTKGNLTVPDPNFFGPIPEFPIVEDVSIQYPSFERKTFPLTHSFSKDSRGIGVADMAYALQSGREHRASGQLARHILEVSLGIFEASKQGKHVQIKSFIDKPAALPVGLKDHKLDH